jgi:DNA-binding NtrC family response regulator
MATNENIRILILDDERQFTEELSDFFHFSTYQTFQANTVEEGMEILQKEPIDILFLDVRLPGANGIDVLRDVNTIYPKMVVVIVSAHVDMEIVNKAIQSGAFDYLRKPFRYIDMQIAVERAHKHIRMQRKLETLENQLMELTRKINAGL